MPDDDLLARCVALDWRALLRLYADLADGEPEQTALPALALREKARAGELPADVIPALALCLRDAEAPSTIIHLAKTLAAFGRDAAIATGFVVGKLRSLHVVDDETFWTFDGGLYALGYIGGDEATPFLDELAEMPTAPVVRAKGVYEGELTRDERQEMFEIALERVRGMLAREDLGGWVGRQTKLEKKQLKPRAKKGFWAVR